VPEISALLGRNVEGNTIGAVLNLFVALLSFGGISTRAYRLKASNAAAWVVDLRRLIDLVTQNPA
jgi:hypothetical protein